MPSGAAVLRRLVPASLRAQAAIAIALVTAIGVGASFIALYSGTTARLRGQIDAQLRTQAAEWRQFAAHRDISTPTALDQTARSFIASQRYHAESLLIIIQAAGGHLVTNNADVVRREEVRDRTERTPSLLDAPPGLSETSVAEAGSMRVLSVPLRADGRRVGTLRVGNPLKPLTNAQASLRRTFAIVGSLALLLAIAAGAALGSLIAAPLRRMARIASAVEAGDLSLRTGVHQRRGEVGVLSYSFDHMLERLERTFARQREFVSDASHELRTPLTVLRAQIELLDRETDAQHRHEATALLLRRLDELDRLVSDMLTLATAEAGQLVEPVAIELADFFEDLRRDLPLFGDRVFSLEAVDGTLRADPDRLTQVLRNLVRNAVAHTDPGDSVTVAARVSGTHLEITVRDSGPGIPADQLEHVFERFRRLPDTRSRQTTGSGLGLAIARAIVEAHRGRIWAEPCDGGALFRIDLPGYELTGA